MFEEGCGSALRPAETASTSAECGATAIKTANKKTDTTVATP
jgi:hypothetical protein